MAPTSPVVAVQIKPPNLKVLTWEIVGNAPLVVRGMTQRLLRNIVLGRLES